MNYLNLPGNPELMKPTTTILHLIFIFGFTGMSTAQNCTFQDDFTSSAPLWTIEDVTTSGPASPARMDIGNPGTGNNAVRYINSIDGSNSTRAYRQLNNPLCESWIATGDFMVTAVGNDPIESIAHLIFVASENSSPAIEDEFGVESNNDMIAIQVGGSPMNINLAVYAKDGTSWTRVYNGVGNNQIQLNVNYSFQLERIRSDEVKLILTNQDNNTVVLRTCFPISSSITNDLEWVQIGNNPIGSFRRTMSGWVDNICIQDCRISSICCDGNQLTVDLGPDRSMCGGDTLLLDAGTLTTDQWAVWSTGDTAASIEVTTPGTYWVQLNKAGCAAYDTLVVSPESNQAKQHLFNRLICIDSTMSLSVQSLVPAQYASQVVWNNGQTGPEVVVDTAGVYIASVAFSCSTITATFDVDQVPCTEGADPVERVRFFMPNAFTPNGDRVNDRYEFYMSGIKSFRFIVFDRWNNKVFESERVDHFWDGTKKDAPCPVGVYIWRLEATGYYGDSYSQMGWIELIR